MSEQLPLTMLAHYTCKRCGAQWESWVEALLELGDCPECGFRPLSKEAHGKYGEMLH